MYNHVIVVNPINKECDIMNNKKPKNQIIIDGDIEKPISNAYKAIDNDLARDNQENNLPAADLEDL